MFTGIIETMGTVMGVRKEGSGVRLVVASDVSNTLKIDQSVSHSGVCLTVVGLDAEAGTHEVTAIEETLKCTSLGAAAVGHRLNLERCVEVGGRLDGHIVQGHVDCTGEVLDVQSVDGSWIVRIGYAVADDRLIVPKGSITVNGVSLTVVETGENWFTLAIIPYTWEHTTFHALQCGAAVNLEFDVVGKYVAKMFAQRDG
jgi:riboflavin synthase